MKIITFNIRTSTANDGKNSYPYRKEILFNFLHNSDADIICFQEVTHNVEKDIRENLNKGYQFFGGYRFLGERFDDETCLITYKKTKFKVLSQKHYWLSPTPDVPESKYIVDTYWPRIANEILLERIDKKKIFAIINTHFELDEYSCEMSFKQLEKNIKKYQNIPCLLCGDLNQEPQFYKKINDSLIDLTTNLKYSYTEYGKKYQKIDYIFSNLDIKKDAKAILAEVIENGTYISDHFPLVLNITNKNFE